MTSDNAGQKFFLIPPEHYSLLISHCKELKSLQNDPFIKMAVNLGNKIESVQKMAQNGNDEVKTKEALKIAFRDFVENVCFHFQTEKFCPEEKSGGGGGSDNVMAMPSSASS